MTTTIHKHGGIHEWDLTVPEVHQVIYVSRGLYTVLNFSLRYYQWLNITSVEYAPTILCTKLAILFLYRRVFLPHRGTLFDWALRVFMAILVLFYIATAIVEIWECTPREKIWNKSSPGTCVDVSSLLNTSGLFNTITDLMVLLVPIKSVWNLRMTTKRKIGVAAVFTVGFTYALFAFPTACYDLYDPGMTY